MKNVTIAVNDDLLRAGREYAKQHGVSLNGLIRRLLEQTVTQESKAWIDEMLGLMDEAADRSTGGRWRREDAYDV